MNLIEMLKLLWGMTSGHKFDTSAFVILIVFVLGQLGLEKDQATQAVSQVIYGIGGVTLIIGFLHRKYKEWRAKKAMQPYPSKGV